MISTRTCVGCRQKRPAPELVRLALTPDGQLVVDREAPGRGAWLCPIEACLAKARAGGVLARAFKTQVSTSAIEALELSDPSA